MSLQNKRTILLISGIGVVALIAGLVVIVQLASPDAETLTFTYIPKRVLTLSTGDVAAPYAEAASTCGESLDSAREKASFTLLAPSVMLESYTLKAAVAQAELVQLFYSDGEVCGDNAKTLVDGVVRVYATPMSRATDAADGTQYVTEQQKFYQDNGISATTYSFSNGMKAVGYPAGIGTSNTIDEKGDNIMQSNYDYPATIFIIDDKEKVAYKFEAFIPLEDLVKIASSLQ